MSFGPISLLVPRFKSHDPPQADLRFTTHKEDLIRREVPQRGATHKEDLIRREVPQRGATHKEDLIRREVPQRGATHRGPKVGSCCPYSSSAKTPMLNSRAGVFVSIFCLTLESLTPNPLTADTLPSVWRLKDAAHQNRCRCC
jgi:hypothetical protein